LYTCYKQGNESEAHLRAFENHEWEKHGRCAGVADADDYFHQICALSSEPLASMAGASDWGDSVHKLITAGFPVWSIDNDNDQIQVPVCAGHDGRWKIVAPSKFSSQCGGGSTTQPLVGERAPLEQSSLLTV
jgi:hypothetical protein